MKDRLHDEPMCETSEESERLLSQDEILPISLEIGRRILEIFGYQNVSAIVFRLKSTSTEINGVINGERLPSAELLLGLQKVTGASIDWVLTGIGPKRKISPEIADLISGPHARGLWFANFDGERLGEMKSR